jgi:hypothetical protein
MASGTKSRSGGGTSTGSKSKSGGNGGGGASKSRGNAGGGKSSPSSKRGSGKRELIDTGRDTRYVKRDGGGKFKESDDVGRSLAADRRKHAKTASKSGYGDSGDRKRK